jgi:hypothetical protein
MLATGATTEVAVNHQHRGPLELCSIKGVLPRELDPIVSKNLPT